MRDKRTNQEIEAKRTKGIMSSKIKNENTQENAAWKKMS